MQWNWNSYAAAGKHVLSFIAGGVATLAMWGVISPEQANILTTNFDTISAVTTQLVNAIIAISGIVASVIAGLKAAKNASPVGQAEGLRQAVPGTVIITTPEIAKATPDDPLIVSSTDAKVTMK